MRVQFKQGGELAEALDEILPAPPLEYAGKKDQLLSDEEFQALQLDEQILRKTFRMQPKPLDERDALEVIRGAQSECRSDRVTGLHPEEILKLAAKYV